MSMHAAGGGDSSCAAADRIVCWTCTSLSDRMAAASAHLIVLQMRTGPYTVDGLYCCPNLYVYYGRLNLCRHQGISQSKREYGLCVDCVTVDKQCLQVSGPECEGGGIWT